jgi:hypothetical protein
MADRKFYKSANLERSFDEEPEYEFKPVETMTLTYLPEGKTQKWIERYLTFFAPKEETVSINEMVNCLAGSTCRDITLLCSFFNQYEKD